MLVLHARIQMGAGERGPDLPPLKNHKNIGFLSNTGPDPLKITKLQSQFSTLGHHRHASKTPFKWRFAGGMMIASLKWYVDPSSPHQLKKCQSSAPSDKTVWIRAHTCHISNKTSPHLNNHTDVFSEAQIFKFRNYSVIFQYFY